MNWNLLLAGAILIFGGPALAALAMIGFNFGLWLGAPRHVAAVLVAAPMMGGAAIVGIVSFVCALERAG